MKIKMELAKETKGTFNYKNGDAGAAISSLYIQKEAVKGDAPKTITVEIKELDK